MKVIFKIIYIFNNEDNNYCLLDYLGYLFFLLDF